MASTQALATECCPNVRASQLDLLDAARCLQRRRHATRLFDGDCAHNVTSATAVEALGLDCIAAGTGFFLIARASDTRPVCTGGDVFQVWVTEAHRKLSRHRVWATPVTTVDASQPAPPSLYWVNTSGGTVLPGRRTYHISAMLLDSQDRALQQLDGVGPLQWVVSPVHEWLRYRRCSHAAVPLSTVGASAPLVRPTGHSAGHRDVDGVLIQVDGPKAAVDQPQCGAVPAGTSTALVALVNTTRGLACRSGTCTGDAYRRVVRPFLGPRDAPREPKGFRHVLKPSSCHLHFYDETEVGRCLRGRSVLNIGGSVANSVQRGFERLSSRSKPSWWWEFGRTQISNNYQLSPGHTCFVDEEARLSVVTTTFIHHPFRHGLLNVLQPDPKRTDGLQQAKQYEALMCAHDIVIFESGVHDMALPDRRAHRLLHKMCSQRSPCTAADLLPVLQNESWRVDQLASYRAHLKELMQMWTRCATTRTESGFAPFRPIFKLASAPNSEVSCESEWGYNVEAHYMAVANRVAREVVEAAGFEVFDSFPATLHAVPNWYDMNGRDNQHSDLLSDMVVHLLLNQVCHPSAMQQEGATKTSRRGQISGLPRPFATYSTCPPSGVSGG